MRRDEGGYIVIETIGTFIPFLFLILSILALVNIVTLQARIHYALTQTAETLSMYSYVTDLTGAPDIEGKSVETRQRAADFRANIDDALSGIQTFSLGDAQKYGEAALLTSDDVIDDPKGIIQPMLDYGEDRLADKLTQELIRPLVGRYLLNGTLSGIDYLTGIEDAADASLKSSGVVGGLTGIDFDKTDILDEDGNIKIVVQYEINYLFNAAPLPFTKLKVTQIAKTKAWLNGSEARGKGYWD
ncbi:MAG: hypothetical protein LBD85_05985 [Oscillospiraceae bacterium]|jgi:hypothetical protein|nr:hypothetical protein [Oscillospiraceae bacterium]